MKGAAVNVKQTNHTPYLLIAARFVQKEKEKEKRIGVRVEGG